MNDFAAAMGYRDMLRLRDVLPRVEAHVEAQMSLVERRGARSADLDTLLSAVDELRVSLHRVIGHPSTPEVIGGIVNGDVASAPKVYPTLDRTPRLKVTHNGTEDRANPNHDDDPFPRGAA